MSNVIHSPAAVTLVMASIQQIAQCVLWVNEFKSEISVLHHSQHIYGQNLSIIQDKTIIHGYNQFKETKILTSKNPQTNHAHQIIICNV